MKRTVILLLLVAAVVVPLARADSPPAATTDASSTGQTSTEPSPPEQPPPTDPSSELLPDGVTIGGIPVGGLTAETAAQVVQSAFDRPLVLTWSGRSWQVAPFALGASAHVAAAVNRARTAAPGSEVQLVVGIRARELRGYVDGLARRYDRTPKDSTVRLVGLRPRISEPKVGVQLERALIVSRLAKALRTGDRAPIPLLAKMLRPKVTPAAFRSVIVIRRGSHRLYLYKGEQRWRIFGVAVGQPVYPTPLGHFTIVQMWRNPWWYPPPSPWAEGEKPIPPGPGNPLGTRWMGLSAPAVGIHGTPDAASIGYSASHGCIRMRIPDAEWLFDHVRLGTHVFIVPQ